MLDAAEEALDGVAFFIDGGIERAAIDRAGSARDDGNGTGRGDGVHRALSIIGLVREDEAGAKAAEQRFDLGDVVAFAACQNDPHRQAQRVCRDVDLGTQTTFGAPERVSLSPLFGAPALC